MSDTPTKVLIVEDNSFMSSSIERMLEDMNGIEIVGVATDGRSAIELAAQAKPDIVLMDIVLPEMDGIEASRLIKLQHPDCRVLMVSGDEGEDSIVAAFAAGADGFCTKSTVFDQLETALRAVASGKTWLDPVIGERVLENAHSISALKFTIYAKLGLSALEVDVFQLFSRRQTDDQIAEQLSITVDEARQHIRTVRDKLTGRFNC